MDTQTPIVSFDKVSKQFTQRHLFSEISFQVYPGEFLYLVGKTGIGKSSILKLMYADFPPDKGSIQVAGFQVAQIERKQIPFLRRKLGIVFQDFQLLYDRNVYENLNFALKATGWKDKTRIKQRITEVLVKVGMSSHMHTLPHQLSGGEKQRLAIARALVNDPVLMIADEPTGNLDPEASEQILQILRKINLSGTTVIMASHQYTIIEKYPSRVLQLQTDGMQDYPRPDIFLKKFSLL